jgi:hypothetical protein
MKMLNVGGWFAALFTLAACGSSSSGVTTSTGGASSGASAGGATAGGGTSTAGGAPSGGMGGSAGSLASGGTSGVAGSSGTGGSGGAGGVSPSGPGLHVVGNHFEDNGKTVRLIGWNRPGGEYSCIGNKPSAFDGPTDAGSIQAMQAWKGFNTVRLPLNETCWLGINGVNAAASGANYIKAVSDYVSLFRAQGIYVIVEMHWNAPGSSIAKSQMPMADADHAADFWTGVANQFKGDLGVVFDLYNEPHLDSVAKGSFVAGPNSPDAWSCWLNGGCTLAPQTWEQQTGAYKVAGMQAMLDAVRATGAKNVVLAGGLNWAGDLSGWAAHAPHDSASNLAAAGHVYYKPELCMGAACYSTLQSFAQAGQLPLVTGEVGEFDCMHSFIHTFMGWADTSGVSYLAWSWSLEPCGSPGPGYSAGPSLISDWQGTPTVYGQGFKDHLSTLAP